MGCATSTTVAQQGPSPDPLASSAAAPPPPPAAILSHQMRLEMLSALVESVVADAVLTAATSKADLPRETKEQVVLAPKTSTAKHPAGRDDGNRALDFVGQQAGEVLSSLGAQTRQKPPNVDTVPSSELCRLKPAMEQKAEEKEGQKRPAVPLQQAHDVVVSSAASFVVEQQRASSVVTPLQLVLAPPSLPAVLKHVTAVGSSIILIPTASDRTPTPPDLN